MSGEESQEVKEETTEFFFEPKESCDVILTVEEEVEIENEEKLKIKKFTFHVHSLILKMASPKFQEVLQKDDKIIAFKFKSYIIDEKISIFHTMLKLIYPNNEFNLNMVSKPEVEQKYSVCKDEYMLRKDEYNRNMNTDKDWREILCYELLKFAEMYNVERLFNEVDHYLASGYVCPNNQCMCTQHLVFYEKFPGKLPFTVHRAIDTYQKYGQFMGDFEYIQKDLLLALLEGRRNHIDQVYKGKIAPNRDSFRYKNDTEHCLEEMNEFLADFKM